MQGATTLAIGNTGIQVPEIPADNSPSFNRQYRLVKVLVTVPTLNAGIHTFASSVDNGQTWVADSGPIALTGKEIPNPSAAGNTGGFVVAYGPYAPGTMFRLTSSVAQTATASVMFGV